MAMVADRAQKSLLTKILVNWDEYLWILPALSFVIFFTFFASVYSISLSFFDYRLNIAQNPFVGLRNYLKLYSDTAFWEALLRSMLFLVLSVPLTIVVGLFLAKVIQQRLAGLVVFRTCFIIPWVIPMVAAGFMLVWIFNDLTGILNRAIQLLGLRAVPWMSRRGTAFTTIIIASVWKTYTFGMLILLAGLQGIPLELYESAAIDGAGKWKQFWLITLPMLKPYLLTLLILRSIWSFGMVDLVFVMTYGGPMGGTTLLSFHMYQTAFRYGSLSYASAMGFHILLLNIVLTLLYYRVLKGGEY